MGRTFDGTTAKLTYSGVAPLSSADPFTVSAWINATAFTTTPTILAIANPTLNSHLQIDTLGRLQLVHNGDGNARTTATITLSTWTHVCAVVSGPAARAVYIGGANKISTAVSVADFSGLNSFVIGDLGTQFFNGSIAFPAIWNKVLADSEIASLAAKVDPRLIQSGNLVAFSLFTGLSPEPDFVAAGSWAIAGTSNFVADPFVIGPSFLSSADSGATPPPPPGAHTSASATP